MRRNTILYVLSYILILIILGYVQLNMNQIDISIAINGIHNSFIDLLCKYGTFLGDGIFVILATIIIYRFNPKLAACILFAYLLSAGLAQLLKHTVFSANMRPLAQLQNLKISNIHLVYGVELNYKNSFPSGHSTTAFAFFTVLAFFSKRTFDQLLFLFLACFVAFTRVYLMQHFLIDVYMGSFIGTLTAFLVCYFLITKHYIFLLMSKLNKDDQHGKAI